MKPALRKEIGAYFVCKLFLQPLMHSWPAYKTQRQICDLKMDNLQRRQKSTMRKTLVTLPDIIRKYL